MACFSCSFPFSGTSPTSASICTNPHKRKVPPGLRLRFRKRVRTSPNRAVRLYSPNGMPTRPNPRICQATQQPAADLLTGNIMRSVETQEHSEVETSTVQRQSEPGRAAVAATAPPIVSIPVVQPNSVGIQRQCSECAEKQQQQSGEEGKDVLEMSGASEWDSDKVNSRSARRCLRARS
jgi:hypothetical protein